MDNPYYGAFSSHPFIQGIADKAKWTISTNEKMPIDMYELIYNKRIHGAKSRESLMKLPELNDHMPNAANYAYCLDYKEDGFLVLDIEPYCPDEIKKKLLDTPYLYGEVSMSGRGYHLIFQAPMNVFRKYPASANKVVLKNEKGYEILMSHYVTFTARQIQPCPECPNTSFVDILEELASNQVEVDTEDIVVKALPAVETKYADKILELLGIAAGQYKKTPKDFYDPDQHKNDMSRYEFAFIGFLNMKLNIILKVSVIAEEHTYTPSERAWFIEKIASEYLPHRDKHDTKRNGLPYLLFTTQNLIARADAESNKKK